MKNIILVLVLGLATALNAQSSKIMADLQKIDSDLKACITTCNAQDGSLNQEINLQNCYTTLDNDIKTLTTDCNNSATLSSSDSKTVVAYINNTLEPDIKAFINCLQAKKTQLSGVKSQICSDLQTLQNDIKNLGACFVNKASSDQKSNEQAALNKVIADINTGISNFC